MIRIILILCIIVQLILSIYLALQKVKEKKHAVRINEGNL